MSTPAGGMSGSSALASSALQGGGGAAGGTATMGGSPPAGGAGTAATTANAAATAPMSGGDDGGTPVRPATAPSAAAGAPSAPQKLGSWRLSTGHPFRTPPGPLNPETGVPVVLAGHGLGKGGCNGLVKLKDEIGACQRVVNAACTCPTGAKCASCCREAWNAAARDAIDDGEELPTWVCRRVHGNRDVPDEKMLATARRWQEAEERRAEATSIVSPLRRRLPDPAVVQNVTADGSGAAAAAAVPVPPVTPAPVAAVARSERLGRDEKGGKTTAGESRSGSGAGAGATSERVTRSGSAKLRGASVAAPNYRDADFSSDGDGGDGDDDAYDAGSEAAADDRDRERLSGRDGAALDRSFADALGEAVSRPTAVVSREAGPAAVSAVPVGQRALIGAAVATPSALVVREATMPLPAITRSAASAAPGGVEATRAAMVPAAPAATAAAEPTAVVPTASAAPKKAVVEERGRRRSDRRTATDGDAGAKLVALARGSRTAAEAVAALTAANLNATITAATGSRLARGARGERTRSRDGDAKSSKREAGDALDALGRVHRSERRRRSKRRSRRHGRRSRSTTRSRSGSGSPSSSSSSRSHSSSSSSSSSGSRRRDEAEREADRLAGTEWEGSAVSRLRNPLGDSVARRAWDIAQRSDDQEGRAGNRFDQTRQWFKDNAHSLKHLFSHDRAQQLVRLTSLLEYLSTSAAEPLARLRVAYHVLLRELMAGRKDTMQAKDALEQKAISAMLGTGVTYGRKLARELKELGGASGSAATGTGGHGHGHGGGKGGFKGKGGGAPGGASAAPHGGGGGGGGASHSN